MLKSVVDLWLLTGNYRATFRDHSAYRDDLPHALPAVLMACAGCSHSTAKSQSCAARWGCTQSRGQQQKTSRLLPPTTQTGRGSTSCTMTTCRTSSTQQTCCAGQNTQAMGSCRLVLLMTHSSSVMAASGGAARQKGRVAVCLIASLRNGGFAWRMEGSLGDGFSVARCLWLQISEYDYLCEFM